MSDSKENRARLRYSPLMCGALRPNGTSASGLWYEEDVLPSAKLPFELFITTFFRIKEWSDNSTTMDHLTTLAGIASGLGNFDYFGLSPEELYERVPVTRDYEQTQSDANVGLGLAVKVRLSWSESIILR